MARYKVTLYARQPVMATVVVEAADEDAAAKRAEFLACCDLRGFDIYWEDYDSYEGVNGIHSDEVEEVDPSTRLTRVRSEQPEHCSWYADLSPASTTLVGLRR